jgi:hypothetical protein
MKILFVNIPAGKEDSEFGQFMKSAYVPLLQRNLDLVKREETVITYAFASGATPGWSRLSSATWITWPRSWSITRHARAKEEGFGRRCHQLLRRSHALEVARHWIIPVVGIGESQCLYRPLMGASRVVHISEYNIPAKRNA